LSALPNVSAVEITVSGQPLALTNVSSPQTIQDWQNLSTSPGADLVDLNVIRNEEIFSIVNESENLKFIAPSPLLYATPNLIATKIATVTADRKSLQVSTTSESEFEIVAQGDQISKPTWDRDGNIYFSDFGQGVREILGDGTLREVSVDASTLGTSDQVRQVAVASDGVRVAVVLSNGIQDVIAVGAIFKTDSETRIIGLHRIERSITSVRDIVWSSATSVAAIGSDESNSELVFDVSLLDGKTKFYSAPVGAQQISVDGIGKLYVSAIDGSSQLIFQQSFGSWNQITSGIAGFFSN
jgi:hypothetical protein